MIIEKKIPQENLERILDIYKPDCRYLREACTIYPNAKGTFRLGSTCYTTIPVEHMTAIEAQLCLNQLVFSAFSEWLSESRFDRTISFEEYVLLMKENMFLIDSNIRFKKAIPVNKDVCGQINLLKMKRHGGLYLAFLDYKLEQGKSTGKLEVALTLKSP